MNINNCEGEYEGPLCPQCRYPVYREISEDSTAPAYRCYIHGRIASLLYILRGVKASNGADKEATNAPAD